LIEEIAQMGRIVMDEDNILSNIIKQVESEKKGRKQHILKFNFDLSANKLFIDTNEEIDEKSSEKYLFIGSADGPNSPQWYVTSSSVLYHLSETINRLYDVNLSEEVNKLLLQILNNFYIMVDEKLDKKYRYILDIYKAGFSEKTIEQIYNDIKKDDNQKNKGKALLNSVSKEFESGLNKMYGVSYKDISLYTILINGKPISDLKEYREAVILSKKPKTMSIKGKRHGSISEELVCSICLSKENVSSDTSKLKIKYYTTNQVIFANQVDKNNYYKNMLLCENCVKAIQAGENFISNKLDTQIAKFSVYIIPNFIYNGVLTRDDLQRITRKITDSFNTVNNLKAIQELRYDIINTLDEKSLSFDDEESYFVLNFVFYRSSQAATKILRLIKDVSPSIFDRILQSSCKVIDIATDVIGEGYTKYPTLETVYYMTPIRLDSGNPTEYRNVLDIYDALLTGRRLSRRAIIKNIKNIIKIVHLGKSGYNISNVKKENLVFVILDAIFYVKFLEYMGCLNGGDNMDIGPLNLREDIKDYVYKMGYNQQQTAMFLLGYLIGEIGNSQYKRSTDGQKPILNKINFNGIDKSKLVRLTRDVFAKLKQEKILVYNEAIFQEFKRLLDSNLDSWQLDKDENLFYILSGYAYSTTRPIYKGVSEE